MNKGQRQREIFNQKFDFSSLSGQWHQNVAGKCGQIEVKTILQYITVPSRKVLAKYKQSEENNQHHMKVTFTKVSQLFNLN